MTDITKPSQLATEDILETTVESIAAGLSGVASSDRRDVILAVGRVFQTVRALGFLEALRSEWKEFQEKGRIKPDYLKSEQHKACLQELLDCLDKDSPDQVRFDAIKTIFLTAAIERLSARDSFLPQQYMQTCRTLSSGEVLVLRTIYEAVLKDDWDRGERRVEYWMKEIADRSGLKHPELVLEHEQRLMDKRLLLPRQFVDNNEVILMDHWRLTNFGWELCRFMVPERSMSV